MLTIPHTAPGQGGPYGGVPALGCLGHGQPHHGHAGGVLQDGGGGGGAGRGGGYHR